MTIEAAAPRIGVIRASDARRALGAAFLTSSSVQVAAVSPSGGVVVVDLEVVLKRAGRGNHARFRCPNCGWLRGVLRVGLDDRVGCRSCQRHRTPYQLRHRCLDWKTGGQVYDELVRKLNTPISTGPRLAVASRLAEQVEQHQRAVVDDVLHRANAALDVVEGT